MKLNLKRFVLLMALMTLPVLGLQFDPSAFTTGVFRGCPPEGRGGDPDLNQLKNRDLPPPTFEPMLIDDIVATVPPVASTLPRTLHRANWPQEALDEVAPWESMGVMLDGYLIDIKPEGPEACNCGSRANHDYHLWIAGSPSADKTTAVVVEISPRLLPSHRGWKQSTLTRLAGQRAHVRISGWLMWDQDHPEQVGVTRGTLWEVHPIHVIQYFSGGRWRTL